MMARSGAAAPSSLPSTEQFQGMSMNELASTSHRLFAEAITRRAGLAALIASAIALVGIAAPVPGFAEGKKAIKVGIMSGEDEDVWRVVAQEGEKRGLAI